MSKRKLSPRGRLWLCLAALTALRLVLAGQQLAYVWVGGAPLDDELMFRAANSISAGQWLGSYDYLTLSKAMFFPVWLALLRTHSIQHGWFTWRSLTVSIFAGLAFLYYSCGIRTGLRRLRGQKQQG